MWPQKQQPCDSHGTGICFTLELFLTPAGMGGAFCLQMTTLATFFFSFLLILFHCARCVKLQGKVNQGKASCRFKSCPFCCRWSTAFSWRESKTWGSRRPTWRSWPDTWPSSTRSVCFSSGQRSEWWTKKTKLVLFSSKSQLQNCALTCRSRELEGDGESEGVQGAGTPSCSLISFAEFNYGAVKNKVCIYSGYNLWGKHCKAFNRLLCSSCVYGHNN